MKLTIVVQDFFSQGAEYAMAAIARGLAAKGVALDLLVSQEQKIKEADPTLKGFRLPESAKIIYLPGRHARENIWTLRKYLKTTDSDAVMTAASPYHLCLRYAAIGLWKHPILVCVDHGNYGWNGRKNCVAAPLRPLSKVWFRRRWFYSKFNRVLFVNDFARRCFLRDNPWFGEENVTTVYNPVVDEIFEVKRKLPPVHPWLNNKDRPTFVAAGAYCKCKNHMMLLKTFRKLRDEHGRNYRIIIYGQGPYESDYRQYIAEHHLEDIASIPGYTNNLPAELSAADGFLLSSNVESFGIVIVEAFACGLPVVSTDAPFGPREVLSGCRYGRLIPMEDVSAMADGVEAIVCGEIKSPPRESWEKFTLEAATERYLRGIYRGD